MKTCKWLVLCTVVSLAVLLAGCSGSENPVVSGDEETGTEELTDQATEDEAASEEDIITEEVPEAEDEGEVDAGATKCDPVDDKSERDVIRQMGGTLQFCLAGNPADGSRVDIKADALKYNIHLKISAGDDLILSGWKKASPAVQFKARPQKTGDTVTLEDDADFTLPFDAAKLPAEARDYHINVICKLDPDNGQVSTDGNPPYFIAKTMSSIKIDRAKGLVHFQNLFFGTFQVMIPDPIKAPVTRHFTYRALTGISMGASGASLTGLAYPEKFDILGILGGVMDMGFLYNTIRNTYLGGFCPYDQIVNAPEGIDAFVKDMTKPCGWCGRQTDPTRWNACPGEKPGDDCYKCYMVEPREMYAKDEHAQGFNHWYFDDSGGSFDRGEYIKLFHDLSYAYGNLASYNPESPVFPAGVTGARLDKYISTIFNNGEETGGCPDLATWMKDEPLLNFYDSKFNPEGKYPVILFCDGISGRSGDWNPDTDTQARRYRMDIALAVDYNGNGVRDYGEPVLGHFSEPFQDCGSDGVCDKDELGYNKDTNPDPNHDDYNPYTNSAGTEANGLWEPGEPYDDFGVDGVKCPDQDHIATACPYDFGEGNGKFDYNPNVDRYLQLDPRQKALKMDADQLKRLNIWIDAGIRDIFNFVLMADGLTGALRTRLAPLGLDIRTYEDFSNLQLPRPQTSTDFKFLKVNYGQLGHDVEVRYGNYNATDANINAGDGRHVGYAKEVIDRVTSLFSFANVKFPNGNYDYLKTTSWGDLIKKYYYYSPVLHRYDKYSIALPPGYFDKNVDNGDGQPDTCVNRYPVVYLMHGYGMTPEDFSSALLVMFPYMRSGFLQKMITVFPNGKCNTPGQCTDGCKDDCRSSADKPKCQTDCETKFGCAALPSECSSGTFYANHQATRSNPKGTPGEGGFKGAQIEDALLELMDVVDQNFCTKKPEDVLVDGATLEGLY